MKRLIVNADDWGFDAGVDAGILQAHREGIVTATSCMATSARFDEAAGALKAAGSLDGGVHLDLTWGQPQGGAAPGLAPGGRFRSKKGLALALLRGAIAEAELVGEFEAQVARYAARLGTPSHLDLHQHFHAFAVVSRALLRVARERDVAFVRHPAEPAGGGLAARFVARAFRGRARPEGTPRATDHFRGLALTGRLDAAALLALIPTLPEGTTELMVHPGDAGAAGAPDRLAAARAKERDALCDPRVKRALEDAEVTLTSFRALA